MSHSLKPNRKPKLMKSKEDDLPRSTTDQPVKLNNYRTGNLEKGNQYADDKECFDLPEPCPGSRNSSNSKTADEIPTQNEDQLSSKNDQCSALNACRLLTVKNGILAAIHDTLSDVIDHRLQQLLHLIPTGKDNINKQAHVCTMCKRTNTDNVQENLLYCCSCKEPIERANVSTVTDEQKHINNFIMSDENLKSVEDNGVPVLSLVGLNNQEGQNMCTTPVVDNVAKFGITENDQMFRIPVPLPGLPFKSISLENSYKTSSDHSPSYATEENKQNQKSEHLPRRLNKSQVKIHADNFTNADEREYLSEALQNSIEKILDDVQIKDNVMLDCLLAEGCLTEDEYFAIRRLGTKDQLRIIVSLLKGRDYHNLHSFVTHIKNLNIEVARHINDEFERKKHEGKTDLKCGLCNMVNRINLKYLVDSLWAKGLISDGLYNDVILNDRPTGAQEKLWNETINQLNQKYLKRPLEVAQTLQKVLTNKNHYSYIAQQIDSMFKSNGNLACRCPVEFDPKRKNSMPNCNRHSICGVIASVPKTSTTDQHINQQNCIPVVAARFKRETCSAETDVNVTKDSIPPLPVKKRQCKKAIELNSVDSSDV